MTNPQEGEWFGGVDGITKVCCSCLKGHFAFILDYFYDQQWLYFWIMIVFNGTCIHSFFIPHTGTCS